MKYSYMIVLPICDLICTCVPQISFLNYLHTRLKSLLVALYVCNLMHFMVILSMASAFLKYFYSTVFHCHCFFTPTGILGLVYTVIIAIVTSGCGIFCTYFGSAIPGDTLPAPFSPQKSPRYVN